MYNNSAKSLNKLERLIKEHNETFESKIYVQVLKIIIAGTEYGYKIEEGVFVIPIGCLKN